MNLFGCLFPCALQHNWWSVGNEQCMTEEFVHRMGVNASTVNTVDPDGYQGNLGLTDAMGVIVRYEQFLSLFCLFLIEDLGSARKK